MSDWLKDRLKPEALKALEAAADEHFERGVDVILAGAASPADRMTLLFHNAQAFVGSAAAVIAGASPGVDFKTAVFAVLSALRMRAMTEDFSDTDAEIELAKAAPATSRVH